MDEREDRYHKGWEHSAGFDQRFDVVEFTSWRSMRKISFAALLLGLGFHDHVRRGTRQCGGLGHRSPSFLC